MSHTGQKYQEWAGRRYCTPHPKPVRWPLLPEDSRSRGPHVAPLALILAVLVLLVPATLSRRRSSRPHVEAPETESSCPPPDGVLDVSPDGGPASGRKVPRKPGAGQRLVPCEPKATAIHGACYYEANPKLFTPPCDSPTFEHDGRCYHMAVVGQRAPTSIER